MAEQVLGRGTIELVADARKLRAGIEDAKRSIRTLGEGQKNISKAASASIDNYIGKLNQQNATVGKSVRETELYKLSLRGASTEQLKAADAALKAAESQKQIANSIASVKTALISIGVLAVGGIIAAAGAFDQLAKKAGEFQDMAEKIGDSAESIASLAVAAQVGGVSMESLVGAANKLTKNLTGVDDESTAAGAAVKALGLDLEKLKAQSPTDRFVAISKALDGFAEGSGKAAVAIALFGKAGAEALPFMKELAGETGRQNILTKEQIALADEYADKQSRLTAQISLHAQAIVSELLPQLTAFKTAIVELIKDSNTSGAATEFLKSALSGAITIFQTIAVVASDVAFVFKGVGREIGAMAAQLSALARLDFSGFSAISDAVTADSERARKELDRFQARIMAIGTPVNASIASQNARELARSGISRSDAAKPVLNFSGAVPKASDGRSEASAQLAFDLDQIKKASDAQINVFSNAERALEALRAASLADERDYYEAKRNLISLNSQQQESALQQQIERLQKEVFAGKNAAKERLDNDRKIADLQAQIAIVRANAQASTTISTIQEAAALKKQGQAYEDATIAAQAYIKTIEDRNQREIEGIGRGTRFREDQAGLNEIKDRFNSVQRKLEGEKRREEIGPDVFAKYLSVATAAYEKEVEIYKQRTAALKASESDWLTGAREALTNYYDETRNIAKQTEEAWTNAFKGLEDVILEFTKTGKLNLKSLFDSISSDITRQAIKQNITGPLSQFILGKSGNVKSSDGFGGLLGSLFGSKTQAGAPVEERSIEGAISGVAGAAQGATKAVEGATIAASITAAGTAFTATITAAGTAFTATITAGGTAFVAEVTVAGATFTAEVVAAGASFAATVAAAGATGGGGGGGIFAAIAGAAVASAKGNIFDSGNLVPFANGGVVNSPTIFRMANGAGLMGEAGPEAVMPLRRGSDGKLGVVASGGGGSPVMINMPITFTGAQNEKSVAQSMVRAGRALRREVARGTAG